MIHHIFKTRKKKINTLIKIVELFQLFLILTFFEKWSKYRKILNIIENQNTISSNRFWKTIQYYHYRWQFLKKHLLRKFKVFEFEELNDIMKRQKFQNRKTIHIHSLLWISNTIEKMIEKNYIRVDMSNFLEKSEFFRFVIEHQVHTCRKNLCRKNLNDDVEQCIKKFSVFFSNTTRTMKNDLRYTYKRTKKTNR